MLIVRRRAGQSILIAGEIEIEVLEIASNKVKLGVVCPRAVSVIRKEVGLTIESNHAAKTISPAARASIVSKLAKFTQTETASADKNCEQDTSGIPQGGEPEPGTTLGCI
jgi:carbon storage regulator